MKTTNRLKDLYLQYMEQNSPLPRHAWPQFGTRYRGMKPEKKIKKQIVDYIQFSGTGKAWVVETQGQYVPGKIERNVIGKAVQVSKPHFKYSPNMKGHSDIQAIVQGRSLFIELKRVYSRGRDRMSDAQIAFKKEVESVGATYMVVHDLEDFIEKYIHYLKP